MSTYNFSDIESKWQKRWADTRAFEADRPAPEKPKYYCLVMFPYPSGKLHMGHVRNYSIGDVFARYYRMKGRDVIHPIGWDSFGLPAENAAIKNKTHPGTWTRNNIRQMGEQLKTLGISYDWNREIATCEPDYYRWNQWFFIKMWERGLVFRKKARVNWCPSCSTVLANEQVNQGKCWRCDSTVGDRELEQWFIRITDYADRLLAGHEQLSDGWPNEVLLMQKNWIGRSTGAEVCFTVSSADGKFTSPLKIFTTRPDTLFGVTFMVMAPEHELIREMKPYIANRAELDRYISASQRKSTVERSTEKEKTGIRLEGIEAVNPVNGSKIPVFVADYVLMGYGTGAIMAVPAHDQRDWEFARKYNVPMTEVIHAEGSDLSRSAYEGEGNLVNSGSFDGTPSAASKELVTRWVEEKGWGKASINYRLKEWLVSRQRYWGTPIPMIHCPKCGIVPVPETQLPVVLPDNVTLAGTGEAPLASAPDFVNTTCPECGGPARRETDTMDTFVDSSWYFARYCDPRNSTAPFSSEAANAWMPVDQYIGGIEHACMHLIYSRFWFKVMKDMGLVASDEPFTRLLTQGMVTLGGSAMSKSRGNIVAPDEIISRYGADTARLFILFAAPPEKQLDWSEDGLEGCWRFLNRVWRLIDRFSGRPEKAADTAEVAALLKATHSAIRKVTGDIEQEQQFNTAISTVMELVNTLYAYPAPGDDTSRAAYEAVLLLLAPFTPHITEELWEMLGHTGGISRAPWPVYDPKHLATDSIELPVQVNGKLRGKVIVKTGAAESEVRDAVMAAAHLKSYFEGRSIRKFIYVPAKIVNIVVA